MVPFIVVGGGGAFGGVRDDDDVGCVVNNGNEKLSNWRQESAKSINRINKHEWQCSPHPNSSWLLFCPLSSASAVDVHDPM